MRHLFLSGILVGAHSILLLVSIAFRLLSAALCLIGIVAYLVRERRLQK